MGRGQEVAAGPFHQHPMERCLAGQVERRRVPGDGPQHDLGELRAPELGKGLTQQVDEEPRTGEARPHEEPVVLDEPEHPDDRRGPDRGPARLVVEAHVPPGHGGSEAPAGIRHPPDRLGELPHHLGPLGVAEVQAIRDGQGRCPHHRHVACGFGHRVRCTEVGIEVPEPAAAVAGERQGPQRPLDADHRGIAARTSHRGALHQLVVLLERPLLRRHVRRGQDGEERLPWVAVHHGERGVVLQDLVPPSRRLHRPLVGRSIVRQRAGRHVGDHRAPHADDEAAAVDEPPHDRGRQSPL